MWKKIPTDPLPVSCWWCSVCEWVFISQKQNKKSTNFRVYMGCLCSGELSAFYRHLCACYAFTAPHHIRRLLIFVWEFNIFVAVLMVTRIVFTMSYTLHSQVESEQIILWTPFTKFAFFAFVVRKQGTCIYHVYMSKYIYTVKMYIYNHIHPENSYRDSITFVCCMCVYMLMRAQTGFITSSIHSQMSALTWWWLFFRKKQKQKAKPKKWAEKWKWRWRERN